MKVLRTVTYPFESDVFFFIASKSINLPLEHFLVGKGPRHYKYSSSEQIPIFILQHINYSLVLKCLYQSFFKQSSPDPNCLQTGSSY